MKRIRIIKKIITLKKVSEIKVSRTRTVFEENGVRINKTVKYEGVRKVNNAEPLVRLTNFAIDIIILKLLYYFGNYALLALKLPHAPLNWWGYPGSFSVNVIFSIVFIIYYTVFEYFFQKTPGKFFTHTSIINEYGEKPSFDQVLLRTVIRFIPFEGYTCINGRAFHDSWADTYVVPDSEILELKKLMLNEETIS